VKRFTLTNQGLGTRIQQLNHIRHSKDVALSDKELEIVEDKRQERRDLYKSMFSLVVKNGKRDCEELRKELNNNNISSKWVKHVEVLLHDADSAFVHMTDKKWQKIIDTLRAHRIEQRKVQEAIDKMMGLV